MSGYRLVNRNISSRVRKIARDGDDVTSSGRQFHTWGPATENTRLPTEERWTGGLARQSLQEERSPRLVSERARVQRCTAVEDLVYQDSNFGPYALRNAQPVKRDKNLFKHKKETVKLQKKTDRCTIQKPQQSNQYTRKML